MNGTPTGTEAVPCTPPQDTQGTANSNLALAIFSILERDRKVWQPMRFPGGGKRDQPGRKPLRAAEALSQLLRWVSPETGAHNLICKKFLHS